MVSQMILPSERLSTNITGIRSLVSVSPLVYQQVVALRKLPVAILADELLFGPDPSRS